MWCPAPFWQRPFWISPFRSLQEIEQLIAEVRANDKQLEEGTAE